MMSKFEFHKTSTLYIFQNELGSTERTIGDFMKTINAVFKNLGGIHLFCLVSFIEPDLSYRRWYISKKYLYFTV